MLVWITLLVCAGVSSAELEVVNQWNFFDFDIPFGYPTNENYSTSQSPSTGIEIGWERVFLALPRFMPGAPLSLAFIPRNKPGGYGELSPKLQPYPSWDWHKDAASGLVGGQDNCSGLISVFRARADRCNRLWVLDSGVMDSLVNFRVACPPKILIFDLSTDTLVRSITLPPEVLRPNTLLTNLVLDDQNDDGQNGYGSCDNTFVYMSDTTNPGIVVYDARRDSAWRIGNPALFPEPDWGTYRVAGEYFTLMDGVIGLALSPPTGHDRTLYFQAFASNRISSIPTSVLKAGPNNGDESDLPVTLVGHKSSQAAPLAVDIRDGSLVFAPVSETAIAAWTPGSPDHRVLALDPDQLQFVLDIRSAERDQGNLWVISTRLQKFLRRTVSANEVNLRIMRVLKAPEHSIPPPGPYTGNLLHYKK